MAGRREFFPYPNWLRVRAGQPLIRKAKRLLNRLVEAELASIEKQRVGRRAQRRDLPPGIARVASVKVGEYVFVMCMHAAILELAEPPLRTNFWRGSDEQLEV